MAEIETGNLYEINKTLVEKNEKVLKGNALIKKLENTVKPYLTEKVQDESYFMLLCHDKRDYTVFNLCGGQYFFEDKINDIVDALQECLVNRGIIYGIDRTEDKVALEIWIKYHDDGEMVCYYFFPYTQAVIEI